MAPDADYNEEDDNDVYRRFGYGDDDDAFPVSRPVFNGMHIIVIVFVLVEVVKGEGEYQR
jgi:hypothetical protein